MKLNLKSWNYVMSIHVVIQPWNRGNPDKKLLKAKDVCSGGPRLFILSVVMWASCLDGKEHGRNLRSRNSRATLRPTHTSKRFPNIQQLNEAGRAEGWIFLGGQILWPMAEFRRWIMDDQYKSLRRHDSTETWSSLITHPQVELSQARNPVCCCQTPGLNFFHLGLAHGKYVKCHLPLENSRPLTWFNDWILKVWQCGTSS